MWTVFMIHYHYWLAIKSGHYSWFIIITHYHYSLSPLSTCYSLLWRKQTMNFAASICSRNPIKLSIIVNSFTVALPWSILKLNNLNFKKGQKCLIWIDNKENTGCPKKWDTKSLLGKGSNNQNGNLRWYLPWRGGTMG